MWQKYDRVRSLPQADLPFSIRQYFFERRFLAIVRMAGNPGMIGRCDAGLRDLPPRRT